MYNTTIFSRSNSLSKDEDSFLIRKLLLLSKMAILSDEVDNDVSKYSLEDSLEYFITTLCNTKKLWLNKDECELLMNGDSLTKYFRFQEIREYVLKVEVEDSNSTFVVDLHELENNYRFYLTRNMIKSFSLELDSIVTINVRH